MVGNYNKEDEIIAVYQDCMSCGEKGKKRKQLIADKGLNVRKVSFASEEGKGLIARAVFEYGIKRKPFFVHRGKFYQELEEIIKEKE